MRCVCVCVCVCKLSHVRIGQMGVYGAGSVVGGLWILVVVVGGLRW